MIQWLAQGSYEYEYDNSIPTGWYRCVGGRDVNGIHIAWNNITGKEKKS